MIFDITGRFMTSLIICDDNFTEYVCVIVITVIYIWGKVSVIFYLIFLFIVNKM